MASATLFDTISDEGFLAVTGITRELFNELFALFCGRTRVLKKK
jgi:hypothetical protein